MSSVKTPTDVPQFCSRLARASVEVREKKDKLNRDRFELTDWKYERPNLVLDFSSTLRSSHDLLPTATLDNVPHPSQEYIVVEELLKVFCGGDSEFIQPQEPSVRTGRREFLINRSIDQMNADFIKKCLPVASNFSVVAKFVEENSRLIAGRVNQALADIMDELLFEHLVFVESLLSKNRSKTLHFHELWFHIQQPLSILRLLSEIALNVISAKTRGGSTLSLLHDQLLKLISPMSTEVTICRNLTSQSSTPYMESVKQWIFNGIIYDPFDEFMIVDNSKRMKKDYSEGYWEKMYEIREELVPNFLVDLQYDILNSGKYINVIRDCVTSEKDMKLAPIEDIVYSDEKTYGHVIIKAYQLSSKNLLDYMLNEYNLLGRITAAKKYFLLQQGDFIVQLLDTCNEELEKDVNEVVPSRLAALVEMAIRLSSTKADPYVEQFTSCLKPMDLGCQVRKIFVECIPKKARDEQDDNLSDVGDTLSGYESFMLSMKCEWPVSLMFNSKVQSVYQMLFRHLFYCKYIERLLSNAWSLSLSVRGMSYRGKEPLCSAIALRNRMNIFLLNMEYYMLDEAIEPAWMEFIEAVKNCGSVDDLMKHHWNFLEKCTHDCLLTNLELLSVFRRILGLCKELSLFLCEIRTLEAVHLFPVFSERITYLSKQFDNSLLLFRAKITQLAASDSTGKLLNLFYRQNFNGFYDDNLQEANVDQLMDSMKNVNFDF